MALWSSTRGRNQDHREVSVTSSKHESAMTALQEIIRLKSELVAYQQWSNQGAVHIPETTLREWETTLRKIEKEISLTQGESAEVKMNNCP